ncbi:Uncharacterised protein [Dorea longicatena]|nr:Uncharacterised protein [Dorea longicatena]
MKSCFLIYCIKNLITKIDTTKETTHPNNSKRNSCPVNAKPNLSIFRRLHPNITGIARKNVNSAATLLDAPMINPPKIVAPDLDVPGIIANTWNPPIARAIGIVSCESFVACGVTPSCFFSITINKIP